MAGNKILNLNEYTVGLGIFKWTKIVLPHTNELLDENWGALVVIRTKYISIFFVLVTWFLELSIDIFFITVFMPIYVLEWLIEYRGLSYMILIRLLKIMNSYKLDIEVPDLSLSFNN